MVSFHLRCRLTGHQFQVQLGQLHFHWFMGWEQYYHLKLRTSKKDWQHNVKVNFTKRRPSSVEKDIVIIVENGCQMLWRKLSYEELLFLLK
ncbi:hypothetical protein EPI10_031238 [Gossypium australe]|uniref:Uncharacterized protein n=1 Tax=Gossypium australe TaxID=47621 RepID=A0A5B6WZR6_9ROSI|nr:hypothetical protein EPI10_031238 [Gossypium australe]